MTVAELTKQAELSEAEAQAVLATKREAEAVKRELGDLVTGHKPRSLKTRSRRKASQTIPDYQGLTGIWVTYLEVAKAYEGKVPAQDRDDVRHDIMIELDRATKRDGKPLPQLRAYRIASLTVALYYRELNRFSARVCIYNGYPSEPHCKACSHKSESKRCCWLAVRPVARLDSEILDPEGYRAKLLDTVASDQAMDLPDKWYDLNEVMQGLPLRLVEIAYKRLEGKPLTGAERKYLCKALKQAQKRLL